MINLSSYLLSDSKYPGLDFIRSIAIILVLLFHWNSLVNTRSIYVFEFGWIGVNLFFALSGFLIFKLNHLQIKEGSFDLVQFYFKRFFRIFPLFVLFVLINIWKLKSEVSILDSVKTIFFLFPYVNTHPALPPSGTWSLAVEEYFYVLFGLSAFLSSKTKKYQILFYFSILVCFGVLLFRIFQPSNLVSYWGTWVLPHIRMDEMFIPMLVTVLMSHNISYKTLLSGLFMILGTLFWISSYSITFHDNFNYVLFVGVPIFLSCGMSLVTLNHHFFSRFGKNKIIKITARLSYSLYLGHFLVFAYFKKTDMILLPFFLVFALSVLTFVFVEYPFLNFYKDKVSKKSL